MEKPFHQESPSFLKHPHVLETKGEFIALADVLEGFSGKAKITKKMWERMFPPNLDIKNRIVRISVLRRTLAKNPDAQLAKFEDLSVVGLSTPELHTGFGDAPRFTSAPDQNAGERTMVLSDDDLALAVGALSSDLSSAAAQKASPFITKPDEYPTRVAGSRKLAKPVPDLEPERPPLIDSDDEAFEAARRAYTWKPPLRGRAGRSRPSQS